MGKAPQRVVMAVIDLEGDEIDHLVVYEGLDGRLVRVVGTLDRQRFSDNLSMLGGLVRLVRSAGDPFAG